MKKRTAERAAKWWADLLRQGGYWQTEIEERMRATFPEMAAEMDEGQASLEQHWREMADVFERALVSVLLDPPKGSMHTYHHVPYVSFGVDYNPADDPILSKAANLSFLHLTFSALPRKTLMRITGDRIEVSCGYAADWEILS
jgi:hypothetical protein